MKEIKVGQIWVTKQNHKALNRDSGELARQHKRTTWAIDWVDDLILCVDDIDDTIVTGSPFFSVSVSHPNQDCNEGLPQLVAPSDILEFCDYIGEL